MTLLRSQTMLKHLHEYSAKLLNPKFLRAAGVALLALFGLIFLLVKLIDPPVFDLPLTLEAQEPRALPLGAIMLVVSLPGYEPWAYLLPLVVGAIALLVTRPRAALFELCAGLLAGLALPVKALARRPRPDDDLVSVFHHLSSYSFPSGHTTEYTLVFGFLFYLAVTELKHGPLRYLLLAASAVMVVLVGPSRVWLGEHWASDVAGGYALGGGVLLLIGAYRARFAPNAQDTAAQRRAVGSRNSEKANLPY